MKALKTLLLLKKLEDLVDDINDLLATKGYGEARASFTIDDRMGGMDFGSLDADKITGHIRLSLSLWDLSSDEFKDKITKGRERNEQMIKDYWDAGEARRNVYSAQFAKGRRVTVGKQSGTILGEKGSDYLRIQFDDGTIKNVSKKRLNDFKDWDDL